MTDTPLARAWELKDACYAAWSRRPAEARVHADALAALALANPHAEVAALAAWTRGIAELAEGRMVDALASLAAAGDGMAALGHAQRAAETQVPRIVALAMLGRQDEAIDTGRAALAAFAAAGDDAAAGRVELNLGSLLLRLDRYDEAARHYRAAAARFARAGDGEHSVMADIGLATVMTWRFDFDEALRLYARAAARAQRMGLALLEAVIAASRGRLALHRGHHAEALHWLESALAGFEKLGNPQRLAEARRDLGDAYFALNLLPEALALDQASMAGGQAAAAPLEQAWATLQHAQVLARLGGDAAPDLAQAHALFQAQGHAVGLARVELLQAEAALARGNAGEALEAARRAYAAFADAGIAGWQHEAALAVAAALAAAARDDEASAALEAVIGVAAALPEIEARARAALGRLHAAGGRPATARVQLQRAVGLFESQRAGLRSDAFRTAYGSDKQAAYDALVGLALDDTAADAPAALLHAMEQARSRALAGSAPAPAGPAPEREAWHWLYEQAQAAWARGDASQAANWQQRLQQAEADWLQACRRAEAAAPAATGPAGAPLPDAGALQAALQAALPAGTVLVAFFQLGARVAACVVDPSGVSRTLLDGDGLDDRIARARFQLDALRNGALRHRVDELRGRAEAHLRALHARLWAPLAGRVGAAERVVVLPHRSLHYVPFAALQDEHGGALVDRHAIVHAPSAALWLAGLARAPGGPPRRAVVLGHGGEQLPRAVDEVRAVAAAFGDANATLLVDAAATAPALRAALPGADVLHLACHGRFRADSPAFSSLQLADGPLTLADAAALPAPAHLVTLSACETGVSHVAPGDELLGLVRGFVRAGAPNVLASQWPVDDAATAPLMAGFYRRLLAGMAPAHALREAQRETRRDHDHPWFWGAFALHGCG